ncbi:HpcH/HpaI aldolase/citrate lyase family protein [Roseateles violae]|uniref:CoA ester lyase n=1 Tax=Roseateles violae TaxID=3058042 RepID=A0ABT8DQ22_9BURK|nr:CoA ester lyase [Pelomonas sp. PFR6]MDN3920073.1 CoA ester lyase [Pelomonas sp. PFR6]
MSPRSYLFVPGNRPERFEKALASGADAVVLDLEDAVAPEAKGAARDAIASWAASATNTARERIFVRINDASSSVFEEDLRVLREARIAGAMLPKAELEDPLKRLAATVEGIAILALVETARGVEQAQIVAAGPAVTRLVFGTLDFALDLDLDIGDSNEALAYAASRLAIASRLAGLESPVAGVTPQIDDEARLLSDAAWSRRHGFGAKLCIHPRQIATVHAVLSPSPAELAWAQRVLAADAASPGAAQVDGRMIDRPVVLQAQRLLKRAPA